MNCVSVKGNKETQEGHRVFFAVSGTSLTKHHNVVSAALFLCRFTSLCLAHLLTCSPPLPSQKSSYLTSHICACILNHPCNPLTHTSSGVRSSSSARRVVLMRV